MKIDGNTELYVSAWDAHAEEWYYFSTITVEAALKGIVFDHDPNCMMFRISSKPDSPRVVERSKPGSHPKWSRWEQ
jgi:hypothetical protein